ncbi:MAG: hypothetical protein J0I95_00410 [Microbacterium sp.]|uniref:hypothetical protein n=1 Tax=unclassified Microbacterium TaxID=2609290 RepID=UPI000956459C|nr:MULTISPECIES: hypothetical protein [unclassified Microbacterium]MBN9209964.1 hypothetical protein [Microbacterium sp.]SIR76680.1 hypothetical protein SAMN05880568_1371 [Microbacterium sp. RURRCA19A]
MVLIVAAIAVGIVTWIVAALAAGIGIGRIIARADSEEGRTLDTPSGAGLTRAITF